MLSSRRFLLSLFLTLLFIYFFMFRVDVKSMVSSIGEANYLFLIPSVMCCVLALLWRTLRWQLILKPLAHFSFGRLWPVIAVGYAANNVLPARLGELVRAYYLNRREGIDKSSALGTILLERVFDGLALLLLVGLVSFFIPVVGLFQNLGEQSHINWLVLTLGLSVPFFFLTAVLILASLWPNKLQHYAKNLMNLLPIRITRRLEGFVLAFVEGVSALRNPGRFISVLLFSLPIWLTEACLYFLMALGFELDGAFLNFKIMVGVLILTTATSNLAISIPSTGGGVGPFEFFAQSTLIFFGIDAAVASAYALIVHLVLLIPVTIIGLVYLWVGDSSLLELAKSSGSKEPE